MCLYLVYFLALYNMFTILSIDTFGFKRIMLLENIALLSTAVIMDPFFVGSPLKD